MGLYQNAYAKVWEVRQNGKKCSGKISVSRKDKETGEYKTVFSGYVNFAGKALEKVSGLGLPDVMDRNNPVYKSIQITSSPDITSWFNKEKYAKMTDVIGKVKKYLNEAELDELTRCVGRAYDSKDITIWDVEVSQENQSSAGSEKKNASSSNEDDEVELPF